MIIEPRNVVSVAPVEPGTWEVTFRPSPEAAPEVCPVIGWAVVVTAFSDGAAETDIRPAFLWGSSVWTEFDLIEHAPDFVGYDVRRPTNPLA